MFVLGGLVSSDATRVAVEALSGLGLTLAVDRSPLGSSLSLSSSLLLSQLLLVMVMMALRLSVLASWPSLLLPLLLPLPLQLQLLLLLLAVVVGGSLLARGWRRGRRIGRGG